MTDTPLKTIFTASPPLDEPSKRASLEDFKVGDLVRDRIHPDFVGIITVDIRWLNGTRRFFVDGTWNGDMKLISIDDCQCELVREAAEDLTPEPEGDIEMGDLVRDKLLPKCKGIVTGIYLNLNGCVQYELGVPDKKGTVRTHILLHENEIELVKENAVAQPKTPRSGCSLTSPVR